MFSSVLTLVFFNNSYLHTELAPVKPIHNSPMNRKGKESFDKYLPKWSQYRFYSWTYSRVISCHWPTNEGHWPFTLICLNLCGLICSKYEDHIGF